MKYQAYALTVNLKSLWEKAFFGEVIVINFEGKENASFECLNFWQALCNYRRKVRKYKLNPLYKDEWSRIERTKITRLSLTCFMIVKKDLNASKLPVSPIKKKKINKTDANCLCNFLNNCKTDFDIFIIH